MTDDDPTYEAWLKSLPQCVQDLAAEFPLGSTCNIEGKRHWLIGYTEDDALIMSPIDPWDDYEGSKQDKIYCCASHFRNVQ